jgi:hypothetical protein
MCASRPESDRASKSAFAPKSGHHSWPLRKSALCQKRMYAPQQNPCLFDHLVGAGVKRRRHANAERLCGLKVHAPPAQGPRGEKATERGNSRRDAPS